MIWHPQKKKVGKREVSKNVYKGAIKDDDGSYKLLKNRSVKGRNKSKNKNISKKRYERIKKRINRKVNK